MDYARTRTQRGIAKPAAIALAATGLTQLELGQALGVSQPAVSQYLSGNRVNPRLPGALAELIGHEAAERVLVHVPAPANGASA